MLICTLRGTWLQWLKQPGLGPAWATCGSGVSGPWLVQQDALVFWFHHDMPAPQICPGRKEMGALNPSSWSYVFLLKKGSPSLPAPSYVSHRPEPCHRVSGCKVPRAADVALISSQSRGKQRGRWVGMMSGSPGQHLPGHIVPWQVPWHSLWYFFSYVLHVGCALKIHTEAEWTGRLGLKYTHYWYMSAFSVISDSETPWTVAHQAPLSMGFSRQEYWSGLPFPPPGNLPDPGNEPISPEFPALAGRFFTTEPPM